MEYESSEVTPNGIETRRSMKFLFRLKSGWLSESSEIAESSSWMSFCIFFGSVLLCNCLLILSTKGADSGEANYFLRKS
jgi:hypothetical protein